MDQKKLWKISASLYNRQSYIIGQSSCAPSSIVLNKNTIYASTFTSPSSITMFSYIGDLHESQPSTSSSSSSIEWSQQACRHFKFSEILSATDNFDESLVIGRGGFGKVYKGNVVNGSTVAVAAIKRLDPMSDQGASEFWAEVNMLSKLRHCHLVSLFGYCKYKKEMILVYEYMPNGTLEDHLHKLGTPLSWLKRLKICIGAARGLDYLHTGTGINVGVIHRDVKSSNILLDESWAAKISDFGLSKTGPTNQSVTNVNTRVKGTFGYLDPDYSFTGMLTRKSDVYAFGVVLLEVLCRKRAVDRSHSEEPKNLARWAQKSIKEDNLKQIIDSSVRGEISPKCLKDFVRIVERCLLFNPKLRPTMAEIVASLISVLTLQKKTNTYLQANGKTIFGKMLDMFPSSSNRDTFANGDSRLSSKEKRRNTNLKVFKFADLKRATRNFSQDLLLGKGQSGEVFLGWVDKNTFAPSREGVGIAVAVKRYNEEALERWQAEATILGWLSHPNIISILGYCDDKKSQRLIIYECMQKSNLHHFLCGDAPDVAEPLSWGKRLMIMLGVARGLAYIHVSNGQVIHRDVKSSKILLDPDFNAKLGGFGAVKFGPEFGDTHITTLVVGTFGYIDPEYFQTSQVTVKSDIYSFGVVLLETITGQRAYDVSRLDDERNLVRWASPFLTERSELKKIIDPRLEQNYSLEGAFECASLALRCVALDRRDRPSSEEVLRTLHIINSAHGDPKLSSKGHSRNTTLKVFKFADLEMATRHFSGDLLLGKGHYGEVFLGWVDKNTFAPSTEGVGIAVAVKRYRLYPDRWCLESWQTEVSILGWLAHPNIIRLLGYCNVDGEHLIVYESMQTQNLHHFLFGVGAPLSWRTRVSIMRDVAHGLSYMHSSKDQVIHRDVKTSSILLDRDFNAKLGGFGAVRFGNEFGDTHITTLVMGTLGYVDPQYLQTNQMTVKSDIYSFGVVLLETITGQQAFDMKRLYDERNLVRWASPFLTERSVLKKIIDPRLEQNYSLDGAFEYAALALRCVASDSRDRPSSEEVLWTLDQIYDVNT